MEGGAILKIYAVKKGHKTGIFDNWAECQSATKGFSSPEFKSFTTREEAEAYLEDRDVWVEQVAKDNSEGFRHAPWNSDVLYEEISDDEIYVDPL